MALTSVTLDPTGEFTIYDMGFTSANMMLANVTLDSIAGKVKEGPRHALWRD